MTSTRSAAATGLPSDRRAFLGSSAAMAAALSTAAVPASATETRPDLELLDLGAQLAAAEAREEGLASQIDELLAQHPMPEPIEAVRWRPSDFMSICTDHKNKCELYGEGPDAFWFYDEGAFANRLREDLAFWKNAQASDEDHGACDHIIARLEEIVAGLDTMVAKTQAIDEASGCTALRSIQDVELALIRTLQGRIVSLPASSLAGFAVKARIALGMYLDPAFAPYLSEVLSKKIAKSEACGLGWENAATFAILIELAQLGNMPAASAEQDGA